MTREERNAGDRKRYLKNREKIALQRKRLRDANPERTKCWRKKWLVENPEKRLAYVRGWREKNREKLRLQNRALKAKHRAKYNLLARVRTKANRERINAIVKKSRLKALQRPSYRVLSNIRRRFHRVLNGTRKGASTIVLLGCSIEDFKTYVESKWESGMTWDNYGTGTGRWSLDHIIPCALFDFTKPEHQRRCFHFSNIQPLWSEENSSKRDRVVTDQFNLL